MGQGGDGQESSSASGEGGSQGETAKKMIDLTDCLTDSPRFRVRLAEHEAEISDLESKLDRVVTSCDRMVVNGQAYVDACRSFSSSVRELAGHFHDNTVVEQSLRRFYDTLAEVQSYHSILLDQAQRSVQSSLRSFLTGELKKVKDMKKTFHRVSEDLNTSVHRNAHAPKSKPQEAEELSSQLANMQTQFSHTAIDYGYHINSVSCMQGHFLLDHLLSYMRAQFTFFHQGYDLLREFDPFMRHVLSQVDDLRKVSEEDISSMNSRHSLVIPQHLKDGSPDEPLCPMDNPAATIELEGYLFKRSSGTFKSWNRRWFVMRNSQLCYQSESKVEELVVVVEDLRICTVKMAEDLERRFCFEVVTPVRSAMLQADSEALRKKWVTYLEGGIARALRITASNKKKDEVHELRVRTATLCQGRSPTPELSESPILRKMVGSVASLYSLGLDFLDVPGNDRCADCSSRSPKWASINLGIMLCIECCGIHRNLGVHISKVRSITLDDWEFEVQQIMCALGNAKVNAILEFEIPNHVKKPTPTTSRADREGYVRAKYIQHAFVHLHPDFQRPEIPLAPQQLSLQDLLSSNREKHSEHSPRSTPRTSPHSSKRMLSPSIRMRATKPKSYRPLTQSLGHGDTDSLADSDDDILREFAAANTENSSGATSSMALLAENYKKLERSGKLKNWNIAKLKAPKKPSFTLSGKLSKSYQALNRRFRSESTKSKTQLEHEAHSDNEDSDPTSSATPLLHSRSANYLVPPPKPPRTFKQRRLDLTGDGEDTGALFDDAGDFSSDVLSAIKKMGMVAAGDGKEAKGENNEESREEKFTQPLPNGGVCTHSSNSDSSPSSSGYVSPGPPQSPRDISPLASEPPVRSFLPPLALSPVHEGQGQAQENEEVEEEQEDSSNRDNMAESQMSPASVTSYQTSVFDETDGKDVLESADTVTADTVTADLDVETVSAVSAGTASTSMLVSAVCQVSTATTAPSSTSNETLSSTDFTSSTNADNPDDDAFTEFQSAPLPVILRQSPSTASIEEPNVQSKQTSTSDIKLHFDDKRMSMVSVASTDWYSFDEEEREEEEDNESNSSADFSELHSSPTYVPVCVNPTDEEHHVFTTPPTSPPLVSILGKEKFVDSCSDRESPRPKSASPLAARRKFLVLNEGRLGRDSRESSPRSKSTNSLSPPPRDVDLSKEVEDDGRGATLRPNRKRIQHAEENERPKLANSLSPPRGEMDLSQDDDDRDRRGTLRPNPTQLQHLERSEFVSLHRAALDMLPCQHSLVADLSRHNVGSHREGGGDTASLHQPTQDYENRDQEDREDTEELSRSHEGSQPHSPNSLEDSQKTIEDENEQDESFEDASASLDGSSFLRKVTADVDATQQSEPLQKSHSADTSPTTADKRKALSSSPLTRSATDITVRNKAKYQFVKHARERSFTVSGTDKVGGRTRRSLEEAPNRSKDEDYFEKLIQKTEEQEKNEEPTSDLVASFSDQDFADIFRSSLRGSKVPLVRVETVDDIGTGGAEKGEGTNRGGGGEEGGREEGGGGGGGGGGEGIREEGEGRKESEDKTQDCLQLPSPLDSREVSPEGVESVVIPDDVSPDMYLYQSVSSVDLAGVLCATAHGGNINFINEEDEGKCPMLVAVEQCSTVLVEYLYQNGAKLTLNDERGRGCLHYATQADDASVVVLLLRRGAKVGVLDADGKDPVQIAVDQENGDIVTLLRVAKLKQDERGNIEDQVAEVYRDFEAAVHVDPERMKRRSQASSETSSIASRDLK